MRNLKLIDAVVHLRDIARMLEEECEDKTIAAGILMYADVLHYYSMNEDRAGRVAGEIIRQAKE